MQSLIHDRKQRQERKINKSFYQAKAKAEVAVPQTWNLNELQRNFIESMIEKK